MMLRYNLISFHVLVLTILIITLSISISYEEILSMVNYESKAEQINFREGIEIIDVGPNSTNAGAHYMAVLKDSRLAFIQINLLNLPNLIVIDMVESGTRASIDKSKYRG